MLARRSVSFRFRLLGRRKSCAQGGSPSTRAGQSAAAKCTRGWSAAVPTRYLVENQAPGLVDDEYGVDARHGALGRAKTGVLAAARGSAVCSVARADPLLIDR